ncbi:hypothetical protein AAG906_013005 [Vitis piasezkii]
MCQGFNLMLGEPRGFGFVKFRNAEDAAEAKHHLNHSVIGGREIAIVFAEENRKTPQEMRTNSRVSGRHGGSYRRRSPPRSPRRRYRSYSRSPSPVRHDSRDRDRGGRDYYSPSRSRSVSRSVSPVMISTTGLIITQRVQGRMIRVPAATGTVDQIRGHSVQ